MTNAADIIRRSVTALQAAEALGLNPDRHGRCACPAHNGKDRNCKLYGGDRGFHCFVCGVSGDVIRLVEITNGCAFREAVDWLNASFGLGLDAHAKPDQEAVEAARRAREEAARREADRRETEMLVFEELAETEKRLGELEDAIRRYRPRDREAPFDRRYAAAVRDRENLSEWAWCLRAMLDSLKRRE